MSLVTRRRLLGSLLGTVPAFAGPKANAAARVWLHFLQPIVAPIVAQVPAIYSSAVAPVSGMPFFNGPTPAMSLGVNPITNQIAPIMVDQTLIKLGGTGVLTDALMQAINAPGDSMGFGVVNGELMLVDDTLFMYRTSGPVRTMQWVQTLGAKTISQTITLLLNQSWGRVWDGSHPTNTASTAILASSYGIYTQSNFPLQTGLYVPTGGWPGLGFPVGCPDAKRKTLIKAVIGSPGSYSWNPKLPSLFTSYFSFSQGMGEQLPPAGSGRGTFAIIKTTGTPPAGTTWDNIDFSGLIAFTNHPGHKFTNCYQDASAFAPYVAGAAGFLTGTYPNGVQQVNGGSNGLNFCLRNVRLGDNGDTDPTHLYADNIAELQAWNTYICNPAGLGIYGRQIVPSAPLDSTQGTISPFNNTLNGGSATTTFLKDFYTNSAGETCIVLGAPVPSTKNTPSIPNNPYGGTLPAGMCCWLGPNTSANVDSRNPGSGGNAVPGGDYTPNGYNSWTFGVGSQPTMLYCTFDGRLPASAGYKYGMGIGNGSVWLGGYGGPAGSLTDANGNPTGFQYNAIIGTNQDTFDSASGAVNNCVLIIGATNAGSHGDNWQNNGTAPTSYNGALSLTNNILDCRRKYVDASMFIEGAANPWFALYGGAPKLAIGYQDSVVYWEAGYNGTPTYGNIIVSGNWMRGGGGSSMMYIWNALQGNASTGCFFTQSNPACVALTRGSANENNLAQGPGFVTGENIAFNPNYTGNGASLPPAITAHKVYQVAGYGVSFVTVSATGNTTTGLSVGDVLTATGGPAPTSFNLVGGQAAPNNGGAAVAATFSVASVNGSGQALTLAVTNPGSYSWTGKPTAASVTSSPGGGSGSLSFSNNYGLAVLLRDPVTGNLVNTSASATGTGTTGSGAGNSFKQILRGLHQFSNNWVSDHYDTGLIRLNSYGLSTNPLLGVWQDAAYNYRNATDSISIENNRFLFGSSWAAPNNPTDGNGHAISIPSYTSNNTFMNPAPIALTSLALSALSATQMQVTFTPDPNARLSPDGGVQNPSGYQYMIRQTGGAWPTAWSTLPAIPTGSGSSVTVALPDVLTKGTSYDVMVRGVSCYDSPEMVPRLTAANSNVATALTLAS